MEKYEQISVVGEGSYGLVMKCKHRETDQIVAVKKFLETEEDAVIRKMALREIRMLKRLKHENLVTMIEVFRHRKRFYLVFEYLEGTVLDELEKMPGGLGEERTRERIFQVVRAVNYCHSNQIVHRDVKPENVLVSSLGVVKLCDFGFARIISRSGEACTEYVATRWYRAPELLVGEPSYGIGVDIWAIGCLFAEMMTGDPLFPGESDIDQLYLIVKMLGKPCLRHQQLISKNTELRTVVKSPSENSIGLYKFFSTWALQAVDFLNGCMKMDPHQRLTADELLRHTYFTHDRFPQRFLPALREKVNIEFNNPLLRKFKTEILMSTDKRDEIKSRPTQNDARWRFSLTEGCMKRKFSGDAISSDTLNEKNLITLEKSTQRLNVVQKIGSNPLLKQSSLQVSKETSEKDVHIPTSLQDTNTAEMQMLEKSLESLVKFSPQSHIKRSNSAQKEGVFSLAEPEGPPTFQSLHFGFGDFHRSPNIHTAILHPSISNISFNKDPPKRSPNAIHNINSTNSKTSQVPLLSNPRTQFLKKLERNIVVENIFANGDQGNQVWNNAPVWLNSFATNLHRKKDGKLRPDEFSLPNLPGAMSPSKVKKKSISEIEVPNMIDVTPRIHSATSQKSSSKNVS